MAQAKQKRIPVYMDDDQMAAAEKLLELLKDNPALYPPGRRAPSMSAMMNYLVKQELKRQNSDNK